MSKSQPVRSMTGFGDARGEFEGATYRFELATLNHKFFDMVFSGPGELAWCEPATRQRLASRISRGRVRASLKFLGGTPPSGGLVVDERKIQQIIEVGRLLRERHGLTGDLTVSDVLGRADIFTPTGDGPDREAFLTFLMGLVDGAVDALTGMQAVEGTNLKNDLVERGRSLSRLASKISDLARDSVESHRRQLDLRLKEWGIDTLVPPDRLAQELVLFAERSDITEELVRIDSHLGQVGQTLEGGGSVGHRMEFLTQELGREINTIGSKSQSVAITNLVVQSKEELSRIKEQILNLA